MSIQTVGGLRRDYGADGLTGVLPLCPPPAKAAAAPAMPPPAAIATMMSVVWEFRPGPVVDCAGLVGALSNTYG